MEDRVDELKEAPDLLQVYMDHLGRTVRHDESVKRVVFLTALSAYTRDPLNLFLRGPSSVGKTYNVTQGVRYFPEEDVWMLGGLSPTALIHDHGVLIDPSTGAEIDLDEKPEKDAEQSERKAWREKLKRAFYLVDLEHKVLVFLEAPHFETYNKLRPILSHDKYRISYRFTDKTVKGALKTTHVVIQGWPATIFCITDERYVEDLATRGFTVTPEMDPEKYRAAIQLKGEMKAYPWKFEDDADAELKHLRIFLMGLIGRLKLKKARVVTPYAPQLSEKYPPTLPRDMRDFEHFLALIEVCALLHLFQRPILELNGKKFVMANMKDFLTVLDLFEYSEETTRTGVPGHILNFFHKVVETVENPAAYEDLVAKHNEISAQKLSKKRVYKYVEILRDIGWVDTEEDPNDKRKRLVRVLKKPENCSHYSLRRLLPFFSQKDLENWLFSLKNYSSPEKIFTYRESEGFNHGNPLQDASIIEKIFRDEYFLEPSEPLEEPNFEKEAESRLGEERRRLLGLDELEGKLREKWTQGTQQDFEALVKELEPTLIKEEPSALFRQLIDAGALARDPLGFWRWTK